MSSKTLKGLLALAKHGERDVYIWPVPYGPNYDRWTVVTVKR